MSRLTPCRLLIDPPASGDWNMAVDEVLLHGANQGGGCTWRFYQWSQPTLSVGYFQNMQDRVQHPGSRDCPVVRRVSGGGAIIHDRELTYSLVVPTDHALSFGRRRLYDVVHESLIETLGGFGIEASLFEQPDDETTNPSAVCGCPYLCFQRRSPGDVLVEGHKVAGSAQRRLGGAVLQHGSVLLDRSAAATELPGLNQFAGSEISVKLLIDAWRERIERGLDFIFTPDEFKADELAEAERVAAKKYGSDSWTKCRGRSGSV
ncbi:MAG: lipoate--protein ligase family protein [Pirellulales bacterium]|nr:lipoate--protein ligase family protein [Pirellulales bacterium]